VYHALSTVATHKREQHPYDLPGLFWQISGFFEMDDFKEESEALLKWWNK